MPIMFQPIRIDVPAIGPLELRGLTPSIGIKLESLLEQHIAERPFAVQAIHALLRDSSLSLEDIGAWPDSTLQHVLTRWAQDSHALGMTLPVEASCFSSFKDAVFDTIQQHKQDFRATVRHHVSGITQDAFKYSAMSAWNDSLGQSAKAAFSATMGSLTSTLVRDAFGIAQTAARAHLKQLHWSPENSWKTIGFGAVDPMPTFIGAIAPPSLFTDINKLTAINVEPILPRIFESVMGVKGITPSLSTWLGNAWFDALPKPGSFVTLFPDLADLFRQQPVRTKAEQVLDASGYLFTIALWEPTFVLEFASIDPRVQPAVATTKLLHVTCSAEFTDELQAMVQNSALMRRREAAIMAALRAHQDRNYIVSIPLLFMQLEGILADVLILKGEVVEIKGKLYRCGPDRQPILIMGKKGLQRVEIRGLSELVDWSGYKDHPELDLTAILITKDLARERNKILHGRMKAYAQAKRSVRILLSLFLLARDVVAVEQA